MKCFHLLITSLLGGCGMAQWAALVTKPNRAVQLYHNNNFPLDVRHHLSDYIESRPWSSMPLECGQSELSNLLSALDNRVIHLQSTGQLELVMSSHKLRESRVQLCNAYGNNPNQLVQNMRLTLQAERDLLLKEDGQLPQQQQQQQQGMSAHSPQGMTVTQGTISETLNNLDSWGQSANIIYQYIGNTKDAMKTNSNKQTKAGLQNKMKRLQGNFDKHLTTMQQAREYLKSSIEGKVEALTERNFTLISQIGVWREAKRKSVVGFPAPVSLDELEINVKKHSADLEASLHQIKLAMRHFMRNKNPNDLACPKLGDLRNTVICLIEEIISKSLVIEELPPAVLKKDTKFSATLRLLVGGCFGISMNLPELLSCLVSSSQVQYLLNGTADPSTTSCGEILNGSNVMEHFASTNSIKLFLRKLMLKKYQRVEASAEKAGEGKYAICFTSKLMLNLRDNSHTINLMTISPSVSLIVHTRQIALAEATIMWDNAFCPEGGSAPDEVRWGDLGQLLDLWFNLHTGQGLSEENRQCLGRKVLRVDRTVNDDDLVTWKSFAKDNLPDRSFTFWDWVYSAYDLIDKCLKKLWQDKLIYGFVNKETVNTLLMSCQPNTFLLRFSDSLLGGISASWLHQQGEILHLEPNTHRGLSYISLAERICGLPDLKFLYPDLPKCQMFGKYVQERAMNSDNYVKQNISVTVDLPKRDSEGSKRRFLEDRHDSPLPSFDDDVFDGDFSLNDSNELANTFEMDELDNNSSVFSDFTTPNFNMNQLEPSLAELDLDSLLHTAQNNLQSLSQNTQPDMTNDLQHFFGSFN